MRRMFRDYVATRVIATTKTGSQFRGLLWAETRHMLVLRDVEALDGEHPVPLDGEVVILTDDIDWVQVLP